MAVIKSIDIVICLLRVEISSPVLSLGCGTKMEGKTVTNIVPFTALNGVSKSRVRGTLSVPELTT